MMNFGLLNFTRKVIVRYSLHTTLFFFRITSREGKPHVIKKPYLKIEPGANQQRKEEYDH